MVGNDNVRMLRYQVKLFGNCYNDKLLGCIVWL